MQRSLRRIVALAAVALIAGACSGDDASPTTLAPATTTTPTTTAAPTTTTSTPITTTTSTTEAPPETTTTAPEVDAVGDMTETHEEIQEFLELGKEVAFVDEDAEAYLPDLSNPDPIIALEEAWKFENWMVSVDPTPEYLPFYVYPDSPYYQETWSELQNWVRNDWRVEDFSETFIYEDAVEVPLDDLAIPEDVRRELAPGATGVVHVQGAGERTVIKQETGEVVDTWSSYGPRTSLTILVPTSEGWRVFYLEREYEG